MVSLHNYSSCELFSFPGSKVLIGENNLLVILTKGINDNGIIFSTQLGFEVLNSLE